MFPRKSLQILLCSPFCAACLPLLAVDYPRETVVDVAVPREPVSESERFSRFLTLSWDQRMQDSPEFATSVGYPGYDHKWPDLSWDAIQRRKVAVKDRLETIKGIDRRKLTKEEQLSYDIFRRDLEHAVEGQAFPSELLPISQMEGVQQLVPDTILAMPHATVKDYQNILGRLAGSTVLVDQTIYLLKRGMAQGIVQPAVPLRDLPGQIQSLIPEEPSKSPLLQHFNTFPNSFSADEKERFRSEAIKVYQDRVRPAYQALQEFITQKYLPACRETLSLTDLPNGEAWYAYRVREETTTTLTPKEIHELGLREVARIRSEMEKLVAEAKFQGSFEDFINFLQTNPAFFYKDPEDFLKEYRDITKRIEPELPKFFGKLPRLPCGVKATPAYAENSAPDAIYEVGSMQAGRAGYFVANTSHLETRPKWEMPCLTLHEAEPGHHLQLALAQEMENVPEFRKHLLYTAYLEGWALYAESLGYELGIYRDAYEKYGQLSYEMWRACRLVVDTGLHGMGWTRQQAIDYIVKFTGTQETNSIVEVDRYIVWPGQATSYKVGELKIRELRDYAKRELGNSFDLRAFHDLVLSQGAVPLEVLEMLVKEWVAELKEGTS